MERGPPPCPGFSRSAFVLSFEPAMRESPAGGWGWYFRVYGVTDYTGASVKTKLRY